MKLHTLIIFLACATAAAAAESPPIDKSQSWPHYAFKPPIEDHYPAASRDLNEQGTTRIKLCYDERGAPIRVTVEESSNFTRLDEAAVRWGNAVRVTPGRLGGQPQQGCALVLVRFSPERLREEPDQNDELLPLPPPPPAALHSPVETQRLPPPPYPGGFIPLRGEVEW